MFDTVQDYAHVP